MSILQQDGQASHSHADSNWRKLVNALLPLGVFGLKFLEWWYSNERSAVVRMVTSLPLPPPPSPLEVRSLNPVLFQDGAHD